MQWTPFAYAFTVNAKWNKRDALGRFAKGDGGGGSGGKKMAKKAVGGKTKDPSMALSQGIRDADEGTEDRKLAIQAYADSLEEAGDDKGAFVARSALAKPYTEQERPQLYGKFGDAGVLRPGSGTVKIGGLGGFPLTGIYPNEKAFDSKDPREWATLMRLIKEKYYWPAQDLVLDNTKADEKPISAVSVPTIQISDSQNKAPEAWWVANGFRREKGKLVYRPRLSITFDGVEGSMSVDDLSRDSLKKARQFYHDKANHTKARGTDPRFYVRADGQRVEQVKSGRTWYAGAFVDRLNDM